MESKNNVIVGWHGCHREAQLVVSWTMIRTQRPEILSLKSCYFGGAHRDLKRLSFKCLEICNSISISWKSLGDFFVNQWMKISMRKYKQEKMIPIWISLTVTDLRNHVLTRPRSFGDLRWKDQILEHHSKFLRFISCTLSHLPQLQRTSVPSTSGHASSLIPREARNRTGRPRSTPYVNEIKCWHLHAADWPR